MILLPSNSIDFKALAVKVADEHSSTGKSIEDCLVEASDDKNLTPEEVKRLVEKTNTELSLRHLRGDNKKDSFELANSKDVLARTHSISQDDKDGDPDGEEKDADIEKTGSLLPHTRKSRHHRVTDIFPRVGQMKTAEQKVFRSSDYFALKREYEDAKLRKVATESRLLDNLSWLVGALQKRNALDFGKFASEALLTCGMDACPVLDHLARAACLKEEPKLAYEKVVDDTSEYMHRMINICTDLHVLTKQAERLKRFEKVLDASRQAIKRISSC